MTSRDVRKREQLARAPPIFAGYFAYALHVFATLCFTRAEDGFTFSLNLQTNVVKKTQVLSIGDESVRAKLVKS